MQEVDYNSVLLSGVYEQKRAAKDNEAIPILRRRSLVAWQHINLFGAMDFGSVTSPVDIAALVARYADLEFWNQSLQPEIETLFGELYIFGEWAKLANVAG